MTMIRKLMTTYVSRKCYNTNFIRHSALFINGPKATETFVYLTPHIDFHERIQQKQTLENELARRNSKINLSKLENLWAVYMDLEKKKNELENKKSDISKNITAAIKESPETNVDGLKVKLNLIKENIKKLKVPLWSAEEMAVVESLKLPNVLHPLTPDDANKVIFTNNTPPNNAKNHLDVGRHQKLLEFTKNENYYLKNDAAIFELGAKFYFSKILKKSNFIQFSNPDFVKSLIIEGCGDDHTDPDASFILHHNEDSKISVDNRLHLTGAGSLFSFFAYHAKNVIHGRILPLKYFAMGRNYKPSPEEEDSLFHVSQSSVIQIFEVAKCAAHIEDFLQELIEIVKACYNELGYHYQLRILPANKLYTWESLRIAVEMYSSSLKSYVEVGNLSISGDYISKRLMFTYTDDKQSHFPHVLSGTILNVPKLLACVLEQDGNFVLPECFKVENWMV